MKSMDVHPVADLFPMLAEDELAELAEDIKTRGLLQPIMLDGEGRILDGRNRLAACELAGIEPDFTTYDGDDPDGYALAVNGQRREMTKRQKSIVGARMILLSNLDNKDQDVAAALGIPRTYVVEALPVVRHADLADRVLAGTLPFSKAAEQTRERDRQTAEETAAKSRLTASAPDLLSLVDEERMSIGDAVAALEARESKAEQDAKQREQERQEELERHRNRIRMVVTGWSTVRDLILSPTWPRFGADEFEVSYLAARRAEAAEIIDGLGESDQLAIRKIIAELTESDE